MTMRTFPELSRRRFLLGASSLALFAGLAPARGVRAAPPLAGYPFTLGVAAGDPWPDGFVIWTRLAPRPLHEHGGMPMVAVPVKWQVAEDAHFARVVQSGEYLARPELGHSVHVEVAGLQPARPYWYRFMIDGGDASATGSARTAPRAGAIPERLRIAVAGCQAYFHGWFDAYRHLGEEPELDALFHYGDYIYEGSEAASRKAGYAIRDAAGNPVERLHHGDELYTLDDYRRRYAQYKSDTDLQAAHAAVAFICSFDDHEVDNDWNGPWDQDRTPPELFALRRLHAMQAWYENSPVRRAQLPRADGGTAYFRRLDYGNLLRMHVLDTRSHRSNQICPNPRSLAKCRFEQGQDSSILGAEQEAWLHAGLGGGSRWNLIAQQVWVMPLQGRDPDGRLHGAYEDKWDGFPDSRRRLLQGIHDRKLGNVVIATGDAHMNAVAEVPLRDDERDGPAVATEFLATSISSNGDGAVDSPSVRRFGQADNPFLKLIDNLRGYHVHEISATQWRTDIRVMDQVQRKGGRISTRASFIVEPHVPRLHRA